jgi:hypothetical protein
VVGVDEFAIAQGVAAGRSLDFEPESLVEADGGGVVGVDSQLDAAESEPVEGKIEDGRDQRGADTLPLEVIVNAQTDAGGMTAPRGLLNVETGRPDNPAVDFGNQVVGTGAGSNQPRRDSTDR